MTLTQRTHAQIAPIALLVAGLAAAGFIVAPDKAVAWITCLAAMGAVWLLVAVVAAWKGEKGGTEVRYMAASAVVSGVVLAMVAGAKLAGLAGLADPVWIDRGQGVVTGLILAVIGNYVPKMIGPVTARRCSPAATQSVQRFAGWVFTLMGLTYGAVWVFAPVEAASTICLCLLAATVAVIGTRCVLAMTGRSGTGKA
jgi:hypothetical protein